MIKSGIYSIISPTLKIYVGQSTNIIKRWKGYKSLKCKSQRKLFNSLLKYGVENHKFEILERCDISELNEKERYWQEKLNSVSEGLNCRLTETSEKLGVVSQETKDKLSKLNKGMVISKETIEKRKKTRRKNNIRGYKLNLSKEQLEKKKAKLRKPIEQLTREGLFVKEWDCALTASEILNLNATHIRACCRGIRISTGGFKWRYKVLPQST